MDRQLKQRLVGATVLMALAVIFLPMLLEDRPSVDDDLAAEHIPDRPEHRLERDVLPAADADVPAVAPADVAAATPPQESQTALDEAAEEVAEVVAEEAPAAATEVAPENELTAEAVEPPAEETVPPVSSVVIPLETDKPGTTSQAADTPTQEDRPASDNKPAAAAQETREGLTAWVIQVGSFSSQEKADVVVSKLRQGGFPVFSEQAFVKNKNVFRVRVGPELDKQRAEDMLARMKNSLNLSGIIVRYP